MPNRKVAGGGKGESANRDRVPPTEEANKPKDIKNIDKVVDYKYELSEPSDPGSKKELLQEVRHPSSGDLLVSMCRYQATQGKMYGKCHNIKGILW